MGFKKYQSVEKTEVVSKEGHDKISHGLNKVGKSSISETSGDERRSILEELEEENS